MLSQACVWSCRAADEATGRGRDASRSAVGFGKSRSGAWSQRTVLPLGVVSPWGGWSCPWGGWSSLWGGSRPWGGGPVHGEGGPVHGGVVPSMGGSRLSSPYTTSYSSVVLVIAPPDERDQLSFFWQLEGVGAPLSRAGRRHGLLGTSAGFAEAWRHLPGHTLLREGGHCPLWPWTGSAGICSTVGQLGTQTLWPR